MAASLDARMRPPACPVVLSGNRPPAFQPRPVGNVYFGNLQACRLEAVGTFGNRLGIFEQFAQNLCRTTGGVFQNDQSIAQGAIPDQSDHLTDLARRLREVLQTHFKT